MQTYHGGDGDDDVDESDGKNARVEAGVGEVQVRHRVRNPVGRQAAPARVDSTGLETRILVRKGTGSRPISDEERARRIELG